VDVRADNGLIIIEPVQQPEFDLESLIAGITSQNLHEEVNLARQLAKRSGEDCPSKKLNYKQVG